MITRYHHRNVTWIDVEAPTNEELHQLMDEFSIHPHVAEELLLPTLKPRVEYFDNFIYLILHFPAFRHTHAATQRNQEVDFIIGKDFLITTRYDTIDPLHKFSKLFEVSSLLDKSTIGDHGGFLFFHMVRKLYGALDHELEYIGDKLDMIESRMFDGQEKEMVAEISYVSRDLLNLKQALSLHREVLQSFDVAATQFFGDDFSTPVKTILGEYYRIESALRAKLDIVAELRETNNSLVSTKQNEVMKVLTIMAFVTFPLTLISSLFGMNAVSLPIVGRTNDFWIIVGMMAMLAFSFFIFFKHKKWL
jgi:magnesium transporter